MKEFLKTHKNIIVIFLCIILPIFPLYFYGSKKRGKNIVDKGMLKITATVENLFDSIIGKTADFYKDYIALRNVLKENKKLREEQKILMQKIIEAKKLKLENENLRKLCEFKIKNRSYEMTLARVIGKDLTPFFKVLKIYIEEMGNRTLKPDMPVITNEGLVGKIVEVSSKFAEVMLVSDPRSQISVEIMGKGIKGTLLGRGDITSYVSKFVFFEKTSYVENGDIVITSGHDKVFPRGLEVGYILGNKHREAGIFFEYEVSPSVNFANLERLLIITGVKEN